ncbi:MAG TPA: hypothetical protein ENL03_03320 [Phycisphaerae bacterium]|nr:hypothetical protein [Phycisphaerae bacterium]
MIPAESTRNAGDHDHEPAISLADAVNSGQGQNSRPGPITPELNNPDDLVDIDIDFDGEVQPGRDTDILPAMKEGTGSKGDYRIDPFGPMNNCFLESLQPDSKRPLGLKPPLFIAIVIALGFLVVIVAYLLVN